MRRRLAWLVGLAGLGFLLYRFRRRSVESLPGPDPRADDLRRTLEESRAAARADAPSDGAAAPEDADSGLEARRRTVHERGRRALDDMQGPGSS